MKASKVAFGGIIAALSLALMLLTGLIPVGTYALPCVAGMLLTVIVIEFGALWAIGVYAAVSALSLLFVADKEAALYYAVLLGIYPVLKSFFERIPLRWLSFAVKMVYFNISAIGAFYISIYLLGVPLESFSLFGVNMPLVFLFMGNIVFAVYDVCVTRFVGLYLNRWRQRLKF